MLPRFIPDVVANLRRRGLPLGVDDVAALTDGAGRWLRVGIER